MRPTTLTVGPLDTADDDGICQSQTPLAAGAMTLNGALVSGGVALLAQARRVLFTFAADETGHSFTITGTDVNGQVQTDVVAGTTAGTAYGAIDFLTVTSVRISAAATGAIKVGTNTVASSRWMRLDEWAPAPVSLQCTVTGTVNYTVEQTMQDPDSPYGTPLSPYQVTWLTSPPPALSGATASAFSYLSNPPLWLRVTLNSGSGSVSTVVAQNSVSPY